MVSTALLLRPRQGFHSEPLTSSSYEQHPTRKAKSDPEISFQQTIRVFAKLLSYLSLFKARIFTKLGFITFEHVLRILLLPWPLKIIVDHVILGEPINADGSGFPDYMQPVLFFLSDKTSQEIMSWIFGGRHHDGNFDGDDSQPRGPVEMQPVAIPVPRQGRWVPHPQNWRKVTIPLHRQKTRLMLHIVKWADYWAF